MPENASRVFQGSCRSFSVKIGVALPSQAATSTQERESFMSVKETAGAARMRSVGYSSSPC
jgi:hypothetical protein